MEKYSEPNAVIDAVAANAAEASRTAEINCINTEFLGLGISIDWAAASALNAQLYKSPDGGTTWYHVHSISVSAGTGTLSEYTATHAVTADDSYYLDLDVRNCTDVKVVLSATGGGATDLLTCQVCHGMA